MNKLLIVVFSCILFTSNAQIGIGTTSPDASLDVVNSISGILIPRISLTMTSIMAPVVNATVSEIIYNTSTTGDVVEGFYYWDGVKWAMFGGASIDMDWAKLDGSIPLAISDNIYTEGNVGIGTNVPSAMLHIDAGTQGGYLKIVGNKDSAITNSGYLSIENSTSTNDHFSPVITGFSDRPSGTANSALWFIGRTADVSTATTSVIKYETRVGSGTSGFVNRELYSWYNGATSKEMAIEADGDLVVDNNDNTIKMSNNIVWQKDHASRNVSMPVSDNSWPAYANTGVSISVTVDPGDKLVFGGTIAITQIATGPDVNGMLDFKMKLMTPGGGGSNAASVWGAGGGGIHFVKDITNGGDNTSIVPISGVHDIPTTITPGTTLYYRMEFGTNTTWEFNPIIQNSYLWAMKL